MAPGSAFRFDAEDSEDDLDGDNQGSPFHAEGEDGMMVDGMRVDWGQHFDDFDAGAAHPSFEAMGADSDVLMPLPGGDGAQHKQDWHTRAETALNAKMSREALTALTASPDSEAAPEMRDRLLQRVSDADAFGTRALAALRERQPLENIEALLAEGLELGVETRELVRLQQVARQALELQNKLAAFDICEEQMELRGLKSILNEMERLPVMLPQEQAVRERWSQSNAWLERARAILNPPRTRQSKQGAHCQGAKQRFALHDIESLVQEGATMPLVCNRPENRDMVVFLQNFTTWREDARSAIASAKEQAEVSSCVQEREGMLKSLVDRGAQFCVDCEESAQLEALLWACRADIATRGKTSVQDLVELCNKAREISAPAELVQRVEEKKRRADEWVKRAQGALNQRERCTIEECKELLQDASALEVDSEEAFLLEFQLEAADSWRERVQAQLALSFDDSDSKVLKALLKESDSIALRLDLIREIEARMLDIAEYIERKEQEESECEWAQCDGCNKWRRLGKGQEVSEEDKFFCNQVGKTCDDAEDEWDEEKEEITRLDQEGSEDDSDADDDVSLADRRLMVPGALVYAQHEYYPFWPARIVDPDADHISAELLRARRHGSLLLQFLGNSMSGGLKWIDRRKLVPFTPEGDPNSKQGMRPIRSQDYKAAVQTACAMFKRQKRDARRRERAAAGGSSSSHESSSAGDTSGSSDYSDSSVEELIDYGEEYQDPRVARVKGRRRGSTSAKGARVRKKSKSATTGGQGASRRGNEAYKDRKRDRAGQGREGGASKRARGEGLQGADGKKEAATGSAPLFPKWFLQLPVSWQGSYSHYTAVRDEEQKLKERLAALTAQEDIRREVRNMVFCAFMGALAHAAPSAAADASADGAGCRSAGVMPVPKSAEQIEDALFVSCGCTITAEYRKRYRLLAMALRVCPNVRAAIARGTLTPAAVVGMSCAALDAYGKPSARKKPGVPLPASGTGGGIAKPGESKSSGVEVKLEAVKDEGMADKARPPERAVKIAPLKVPSLLPEVKTKVERPSRSPSPERTVAETPGVGDAAASSKRRSAQQGQGGQLCRPTGDLAAEAGGGQQGETGTELAVVGEVCWVGMLCKAESSTQVRVKGTTLDGARLRAVDRVPHSLKIVGRMPPEALAKFLVELGNSRSRQKTVVRFELPEDEMRDSTVKAYNRLVEEYETKDRVGVINLPERSEQLYIVGPSAAHRILRLDAPGHMLHGVFVMKVGSVGRYWADVHPQPSAVHPPLSNDRADAGAQGTVQRDVEGETAAQRKPATSSKESVQSDASSHDGEAGKARGVSGPAAAADVESAFVAIQALLEATQSGEASSAQVDRAWVAPQRDQQPSAGPRPRIQSEWQGAGLPAPLPPPAPPHQPVLPTPSQATPLPPPARAPPAGGMPSPQRPPQHMPVQPPIAAAQHSGYTAAAGSAALSHTGYGTPQQLPVQQQMPPVVVHGNSGYGGGGGGPAVGPPPGGPNHAQNLQQLQNLSTEQLISLCTQIGMG